MKYVSKKIGIIHFIGIGGIGMSGIAEILHNLGYQVQGSDLTDNSNVARLKKIGISIHIGHHAFNLGKAEIVVVSSAVKNDNAELKEARLRRLIIVRRAEMLAELMRLKQSIAIAGTHGKTTTTSLTAALLDAGKLDPTVVNGGIINNYGTNARLGSGEWIVVEADESDGTFIKLPSTIVIVTNIDPEHLDHYGSVEALHEGFHQFISNIPFYGFAVLCIDHPVVRQLYEKIQNRRLISYGFSLDADLYATNIRTDINGATFDVVFSNRTQGNLKNLKNVRLPMIGMHNIQNSLASIAVANEIGLDATQILQGLSSFGGVKRRFTKTGEVHGITVIDDYGHHPVEIEAVLKAARQVCQGKIIAVIQPHRYSRLKDLFAEFAACADLADYMIVADVYPAGEQPIIGIDRDNLLKAIHKRGKTPAEALLNPVDLAKKIAAVAKSGDLVVCLGAGSITNWAYALPSELKILLGNKR